MESALNTETSGFNDDAGNMIADITRSGSKVSQGDNLDISQISDVKEIVFDDCEELRERDDVDLFVEFKEGILDIKVIQAELLRSVTMFGSMSPYAKIDFNGVQFDTDVAQKGDKNPKWTKCKFKLDVNDPTLEIKVLVISDTKLIGFNIVKISDLMLNKQGMQWYSLHWDNKPAGKIQIRADWIPKNNDSFSQTLKKLEERKKELETELNQCLEDGEKYQNDIELEQKITEILKEEFQCLQELSHHKMQNLDDVYRDLSDKWQTPVMEKVRKATRQLFFDSLKSKKEDQLKKMKRQLVLAQKKTDKKNYLLSELNHTQTIKILTQDSLVKAIIEDGDIKQGLQDVQINGLDLIGIDDVRLERFWGIDNQYKRNIVFNYINDLKLKESVEFED